MPTTRLSSRGQIVIPKALRELHGWSTGQSFEVIDVGDKLVLRPKAVFPHTTVEEAYGCLSHEGPPVPVEDLSGTAALHRRREKERR